MRRKTHTTEEIVTDVRRLGGIRPDCGTGIDDFSAAPRWPWENGSVGGFTVTVRDGRLIGGVFNTLLDPGTVIEQWQRHARSVLSRSPLDCPPYEAESQAEAWPTEESCSASLAYSAIVTQPTTHSTQTWATEWGQVHTG